MLRWGILGAGRIAGGAMAPAMRAAGHDLACVGSRSRGRAQRFAANHGVRRARGSYEEVLEADDVEAVYVALPNDAHEPWAVAALEAGKHVLCEKPLAPDAAGAERIAAAAARAGRVAMEALMVRFHPRVEALGELLADGEIGAVRGAHLSFSERLAEETDYRTDPRHGGGAWLDLGCYGVALARWAIGEEPDRVAGTARRWRTGADAATAAALGFPRGGLATIDVALDAAPHDALLVTGARGILEVPRAVTAWGDVDAPLLRDGRPVGSWRADPFRRMLDAFAEGCAAGAAPLSLDDAVANARALEAVAAAAR